jgi:BRCA1-associated protein
VCSEGSEVADSCRGGAGDESSQRLENLAYEYTVLLTGQLESQRKYFEGLLATLVALTGSALPPAERKAAAEAVLYAHHGGEAFPAGVLAAAAGDLFGSRAALAAAEVDAASARASSAAAEARAAEAESERKRLQKRAAALQEAHQAAAEELTFLRDLDAAHAADRKAWEARVRGAEAAAEELREQVRDLMLSLDVSARAEELGAEGGSVVLVPKEGGGSGGGGGGGKKKGKK